MIQSAVVIVAVLLVSACKGGASESPAPASASTPAPAASGPATPAPAPAAGKTFESPSFGVAECDRFAKVLAACAPKLTEADFTSAKGAVDETYKAYRQSVDTLGADRSNASFAKSCGAALPRIRSAFASACPDAGWDP